MSHVYVSARYRKGPNWDEAAQSFDASGDDVWCGPVGPAASLGYSGWAIWFAEYWRIGPPVADGPIVDPLEIAVDNAVCREARALDDPLGLEHHERLLARGARVRMVTAMEVELAAPPRLPEYLADRFAQSRRIGRRRRGWMAAALPVVLLIRWYGAAIRKPRYLARAILAAPLLVLFSAVQAAGELAGSFEAE